MHELPIWRKHSIQPKLMACHFIKSYQTEHLGLVSHELASTKKCCFHDKLSFYSPDS